MRRAGPCACPGSLHARVWRLAGARFEPERLVVCKGTESSPDILGSRERSENGPASRLCLAEPEMRALVDDSRGFLRAEEVWS